MTQKFCKLMVVSYRHSCGDNICVIVALSLTSKIDLNVCNSLDIMLNYSENLLMMPKLL